MPIYEYHCEQCGDFEEMQRITDPSLTRCPRCNRKVQRLISQTSFQLKGSGWYVTDYGRGGGGGRKEGSADGTGEAKAESKSESKSESKAAAGSASEKPTTSSSAKSAS